MAGKKVIIILQKSSLLPFSLFSLNNWAKTSIIELIISLIKLKMSVYI